MTERDYYESAGAGELFDAYQALILQFFWAQIAIAALMQWIGDELPRGITPLSHEEDDDDEPLVYWLP